MSDMKCPFCGQELEVMVGLSKSVLGCSECRHIATIGVWQELIRTREALEKALDWLEQVATPEKCDDDLCRDFTSRKLIEIKTALEQKE